LQLASVQAETENHEKRRILALCSQLQPVHAAHPSFTNVDHSKKAAEHLVAASLQSRPTWTTGQRASLLDTRLAKSQLLLQKSLPPRLHGWDHSSDHFNLAGLYICYIGDEKLPS